MKNIIQFKNPNETPRKINKKKLAVTHKILFVTEILDRNYAKWEEGKEAIEFTKTMAESMCVGFTWNGYTAMPILKVDYLKYRNLTESEEKEIERKAKVLQEQEESK